MPITTAADQTPSFQRILDAGRELFVENGFPATSMEAIARRARVVRATVYNNFQDKEAILDEIMRQYVEGYVEIPRRLREQARPEQTSFELLEEMIRSAIRWRNCDPASPRNAGPPRGAWPGHRKASARWLRR